LFFIGLKDDIVGVDPLKKIIVHLLVGTTLVVLADIRLTEFWGLFEVEELPYWLSVVLSIFIYIVIVNAINLIDGVDGLAGGIGLIGSVTFTLWFYKTGDMPLALLAVGLAGSLFGFLIFNFQPARIFMGDSGSLIIGICMYVLAMKLIEFPPSKLSAAMQIVSKPIFAMAILAYPLIDTLRVFTIRILSGKSPFLADKNHIHHRLLALGLQHYQVSIALYCYTLFIIGTTFLMPPQTPNISFLAVGSLAVFLAYVPFMIPKKNQLK
jgi:UDP-N-acetylmuramyl pentapeptide phosphotransferase/UDP-N-acetylglucosamine-1-phosphate transferase